MQFLNKKLKDLDNFQRVPSEYKESTVFSVCISILCIITIIYLALTSTFNFIVKRDQSSEFHMHQAVKNEQLQVNLAIKLFRLPCELVSVDLMDKMGKHQLHVGAGLYYQDLDSYGQPKGELRKVQEIDVHTHDGGQSLNYELILSKLDNRQGCYLKGNLFINKVPGNFHISAHAFGFFLRKLFRYSHYQTIDLSHEIEELYFGTEQEKNLAYKTFYYPNVEKLKKFHDSSSGLVTKDPGLFHEYYLKIVPSYFIYNQNKVHYNQYTANHQSYHTDDIPAIFFKYELSPVEMFNHITKERMYQYIVDLCAIIGGVYYIAKLVDSLLHSGIKTIRAKARMGKLQ